MPNLERRPLALGEKDRILIPAEAYQRQPDNVASRIATPIAIAATPIQSMLELPRLPKVMGKPHVHRHDEKERERDDYHQYRRQVRTVSPVKHLKPFAAICSSARNT